MKTTIKKKQPTRFTSSQISELRQLKEGITSTHAATDKIIKSAKEKAGEALAEAIICGKKLARVKEIIPYGGFENWCKAELLKISKATIGRYLSLHNSFGKDKSHVSNLPATNLRKAYQLLGILKEDDLKPETSGTIVTQDDSTITTQPVAATSRVMGGSGGRKLIQSETIPTTSKPAMTTADALSRAKFLTRELTENLIALNKSGGASVKEMEAAVLEPISATFEKMKK